MIYCIADHIASRWGSTSEECFQNILHDTCPEYLLPQADEARGLSIFENRCVQSIQAALQPTRLEASDASVGFIVASTKGNVYRLANTVEDDTIALPQSAQRIAQHFHNPNTPLVVSNACISGVAAIIAAQRLLQAGVYQTVVVVGCDVLCDFITSGFGCLKALSPLPCKPFDKDRQGLNLGEAVATLVLTNDISLVKGKVWVVEAGSLHNDANHISGPSRTGEGSFQCLQDVLTGIDTASLACVSVHGTATLYNDEMESIALHRAGLDTVPITALKGYLGHTLGAAGIVETILTMRATEQGYILPSKGYEQQGTTYAVNIANGVRQTEKRAFIKLLSGFGGCNAAIRCRYGEPVAMVQTSPAQGNTWKTVATYTLDTSVSLTNLYRSEVNDYPKFFKMDTLSRVGFLAVEMLLKQLPTTEREALYESQTSIILGCLHGSQKNDRDYQQTITTENYYPSPSLFVYTLPNIVTGEIAIRQKWHGESSMYLLPSAQAFWDRLSALLPPPTASSHILAGWVDCTDAEHYEAQVQLLQP